MGKSKKKNEKGKSYVRIRPSDGGRFYAPSADIVNTLQPALSAIFQLMYPGEPEDYPPGHPGRKLANDLAYFIKHAYAGPSLWEKEGLNQLNGVLNDLDPEEATKFLYLFFMAMMDYFWHGCRLETEDPTGDPEEMAKAIGISQILRTMPKEMRADYLDHLKAYNMLPDIFYKGALLRKVQGDLNNDIEG